jgi:hypothetical protein
MRSPDLDWLDNHEGPTSLLRKSSCTEPPQQNAKPRPRTGDVSSGGTDRRWRPRPNCRSAREERNPSRFIAWGAGKSAGSVSAARLNVAGSNDISVNSGETPPAPPMRERPNPGRAGRACAAERGTLRVQRSSRQSRRVLGVGVGTVINDRSDTVGRVKPDHQLATPSSASTAHWVGVRSKTGIPLQDTLDRD